MKYDWCGGACIWSGWIRDGGYKPALFSSATHIYSSVQRNANRTRI
jgi:hypothetical protein